MKLVGSLLVITHAAAVLVCGVLAWLLVASSFDYITSKCAAIDAGEIPGSCAFTWIEGPLVCWAFILLFAAGPAIGIAGGLYAWFKDGTWSFVLAADLAFLTVMWFVLWQVFAHEGWSDPFSLDQSGSWPWLLSASALLGPLLVASIYRRTRTATEPVWVPGYGIVLHRYERRHGPW
jgi:hypothetical protein